MKDNERILRLATAQFPTSCDSSKNAARMLRLIGRAGRQRADLIHFPEACLSGYPGHDCPTLDGCDWDALQDNATKIAAAAARHDIWVVFGSAHRLTKGHKPRNSLYVVDRKGVLIDRYDKRLCAGDDTGTTGDLAHFSPGSRAVTFDLNRVRFGTLICHEYRYPELYREYLKAGVRVVLHSFHSGNIDPDRFAAMESEVGREHHENNIATTIAGITQLATIPSAASSNNLWISCPNSSAPVSCWGAFVVRPDGVVTGRLDVGVEGLVITDIDPTEEFYDSTRHWRERVMSGKHYSGGLVEDARSRSTGEF